MTQAEIKKALEASARESYTPKTDEEIRSQAEGMYKQQFENDLKALRRQTEQNILAARRDSLSTGMQRSSYVAAQQGLARSAGLEGQQQLQSNYESNIANAIADLRDKDRDRKLADDQYRNQLLLQLYNMGNSGGSGGSGGRKTSGNKLNDAVTKAIQNSIPDYSKLMNNSILKLINSDDYRKQHNLNTVSRDGKKRNLFSGAGDYYKMNSTSGDPGYGSYIDKNGQRQYYTKKK